LVGAERAGHHRHAGCRQRSEQAHIHADAGEARHQGRFDHVAREPGVLANHHQVAAVVLGHEDLAGRHADPQRHFRGHREAVGLAANAISPEIGALAHRQLSKRSETQI